MRRKNKVNFVSLHGSLSTRVQRSGRRSVGQQTGTMRSDDLPVIITAQPPIPTTAVRVFQFFFSFSFFARFTRCRDFSHDLFYFFALCRAVFCSSLLIVPRRFLPTDSGPPLCGFFPSLGVIRTETAVFENLNCTKQHPCTMCIHASGVAGNWTLSNFITRRMISLTSEAHGLGRYKSA